MTNPKVRDTVFCKYMSTGDHLLALLNAIKGTSYTDPSNIKINTLNGSFYSSIKKERTTTMARRYSFLVNIIFDHAPVRQH